MAIRLTETRLRRIIREEIESIEGAGAQSPSQIFDNSDPAYIEKTLATRNPGGSIQAGSVFKQPQTFESLRGCCLAAALASCD